MDARHGNKNGRQMRYTNSFRRLKMSSTGVVYRDWLVAAVLAWLVYTVFALRIYTVFTLCTH